MAQHNRILKKRMISEEFETEERATSQLRNYVNLRKELY